MNNWENQDSREELLEILSQLNIHSNKGRVAFRALCEKDDPTKGFVAKNPSAKFSLGRALLEGSYVETRYIHATADILAALWFAVSGDERISVIDLECLDERNVFDLRNFGTQQRLRFGLDRREFRKAKHHARLFSQISLRDHIPSSAIKATWRIDQMLQKHEIKLLQRAKCQAFTMHGNPFENFINSEAVQVIMDPQAKYVTLHFDASCTIFS